MAYERDPDATITLTGSEASMLASIALRLAALIDPDPDGLRDASGRPSEGLERHRLTDTQFMLLDKPLFRGESPAHRRTPPVHLSKGGRPVATNCTSHSPLTPCPVLLGGSTSVELRSI